MSSIQRPRRVSDEDVDRAQADGGAVLGATTVERIEAPGATLPAYFRVDARGALFCAALEPRNGGRPGDRVELAVDGRRLHFFDPATESAIGT